MWHIGTYPEPNTLVVIDRRSSTSAPGPQPWPARVAGGPPLKSKDPLRGATGGLSHWLGGIQCVNLTVAGGV
jgi:hypothetical protein